MCLVCAYNLFVLHISLSSSVFFYEPNIMNNVCMPFYVVHYHNNLMKAHHYHKSHQISSANLEKMNIIILVFK